ncbi:uncharacterized protein LOC130644670 [Hydractinia symbiolongicarpus]|uniref:uncharacterized protein LOC130644670 n=1 Tax=Hydractinia symbiolongicarpus TaxID=13093 RepID=UPI00254DEF6D|nr:uncharacterized protein LOC130644670 [Hydractinia symbiolongicarpus]
MNLRSKVNTAIYGNKTTPLSTGITATLFILSLLGSMSITMVFSFLPQLIKSFGITEVEVGHYAGIIAASLYSGLAFSSILWGYLADVKGAKFATILSSLSLTIATLAFGFSTFYKWALVTRFLQGFFMGVNVVTKALMADVCDDSNQALGMTILTCSYATGIVLGPSIGAFLAFPTIQYPKVFSKDSLFGRFQVLLPNLVLVVSFVVATSLAVCTLPSKRRKKTVDVIKDAKNSEIDELIQKKEEKNSKKAVSFSWNLFKESKIMKVLSQKECILASILYTIYPPVCTVFDELFPVFAATSRKYGGYGFSTSNIGVALVTVSIISIFAVISLFSKLIVRYGAKKVFIYCAIFQSLLFPVPVMLAKVVYNTKLFWILLILVLIIIRVCIEGTVITAVLIMNNSASADSIGTINGIGLTLSCFGRMAGPPLFGSIFSWSLKNVANVEENKHPLGFPFNQYFAFYLLAILGLLIAVFVGTFPNTVNYKKESRTEALIE